MKVVIFEFKSITPFFVYDELLEKIDSCIGGKYRAITKNTVEPLALGMGIWHSRNIR